MIGCHDPLCHCRCCRVQLLPIFLALASFGLQDGAFLIVFTDGRPRDWCGVHQLVQLACSRI